MTKRFILTGAMGGGKSTILNLLAQQGLTIVEEPARQILSEQRSIGDDGVPEKDPKYFTQLLLSRAIYQHKQTEHLAKPVIYDRGVPDVIAYAQLFNFNYLPAEEAAKLYRYETKVFFFPAWEKIYRTDDERKMPFEGARLFGEDLRRIYSKHGYTLVEVPLISAVERAKFIVENLA